jgi:hypothetical protein
MTPEKAKLELLLASSRPCCAMNHALAQNFKCVMAREVFSLW